MVLVVLLLAGCLSFAASPALSQSIVHRVEIEGNRRVPDATILRHVTVVPGKPFDALDAEADLKGLQRLGVFRILEIQTRPAGADQVDVIYRVREQPFVSSFRIVGVNQALADQMVKMLEKERLLIRPATPFRPEISSRAAAKMRTFLRAHRYPQAEVAVEAADAGSSTRVSLNVRLGPKLDVGKVAFSGNDSIPDGELLRRMQQSRPASSWAFWSTSGAYVPEGFLADLENVRRYYQSKGFAAVKIGEPEIVARTFRSHFLLHLMPVNRDKQKLSIVVPVVEGARYRLVSLRAEGDARAASADVGAMVAAVKTPCLYDLSELTSLRQKMIEAMGNSGYALAQVQLEQSTDDDLHTVRAVLRIDAGDPVMVGRIRFEGNSHIPDKFLRREIRAQEGEIFDYSRLDASIKRLNRSGLVKDMQRADVTMKMDEEDKALDITFKVKEKDRQGIYATGGTGGIGGGYLGIIYSAFNLFGLGEDLSLQLDGGAAQSNFLLNVVGNHFLGTPFTLGLSVFHRLTDFNVASALPDAGDLINILRRRSTGAALSGSYAITPRSTVGLGLMLERASLRDNPEAPNQESVSTRTDLSPSFAFDATEGLGPDRRGFQFVTSNSWSGTAFLGSVQSTARALQFSNFRDDPLTNGRNGLAFHFQAAMTRPSDSTPLAFDHRFFPGDETVRGFGRGALTPLAFVSGTDGSSVTPVGADTVLGFSAEYRVPIRGPLSGTAFMDLGWSRLSQRTSSLDGGSRLIDATNGLLRASVGGELRLQLPIIHQPGRVIFSWNPLRLDKWIESGGSPLHLADPRGAVRFALGDLF